jgi:hypothetical protein
VRPGAPRSVSEARALVRSELAASVRDGGARTAPKLADPEPGAEHGRGRLLAAAEHGTANDQQMRTYDEQALRRAS